MRDFKKLQEDPPAGVSGAPTENNIMVSPNSESGVFKKRKQSCMLTRFASISLDYRGNRSAARASYWCACLATLLSEKPEALP